MEPKEANQETTEQQELEAGAAELAGMPYEPPVEGQPAPDASPEAETETPGTPEKSEPATDPFADLRETLKDTPYYQEGRDIKEVAAELKKGYKELQGWQSKTQEKVKPYEQLLDQMSKDANLREFVKRAQEMYYNPQLAQAYINPQGQAISGEPDVSRYDMYSAEGQQAYHKDMLAYTRRVAQEDVNAKLSGWEQQQKTEMTKLEFRKLHPEIDPDKVLADAQEKFGGQNQIELMWKALNYENLASQMYEKARKELSGQLEDAGKTKTPQGAPPAKPSSIEDILRYIEAKGGEAARKRYTPAKVEEALRLSISAV